MLAETDEFLADMLPRQPAAERAFCRGVGSVRAS
jgi:hypothetical protein